MHIGLDAGTSSWPSWICHFTGSFVGHSPSEVLCPPANKFGGRVFCHSAHTHTHVSAQTGAGRVLRDWRRVFSLRQNSKAPTQWQAAELSQVHIHILLRPHSEHVAQQSARFVGSVLRWSDHLAVSHLSTALPLRP